jgi:hypothetical protein
MSLIGIAKLFVDDAAFAAAIVAWMAGIGALVSRLPPGTWWGAVLFGGLALILLLGAFRSASSKRLGSVTPSGTPIDRRMNPRA